MPNYKQKITKLLSYEEFLKRANAEEDHLKRAFLELLFWSARRVSEILRISQGDIYPTDAALYINFHILKKRKPEQITQRVPRTYYLEVILGQTGKIFPYSRQWGYRTVKAIFPELYPHYFRLNMRNITGLKFGDARGRALLRITPAADASYAIATGLEKVYDWQIKLSKGDR